ALGSGSAVAHPPTAATSTRPTSQDALRMSSPFSSPPGPAGRRARAPVTELQRSPRGGHSAHDTHTWPRAARPFTRRAGPAPHAPGANPSDTAARGAFPGTAAPARRRGESERRRTPAARRRRGSMDAQRQLADVVLLHLLLGGGGLLEREDLADRDVEGAGLDELVQPIEGLLVRDAVVGDHLDPLRTGGDRLDAVGVSDARARGQHLERLLADVV